MYVALSSALTEILGAFLGEKARNLRKAVDELLGSVAFGDFDRPKSRFSEAVWNHPLITSLTQPGQRAPSYIPPGTFGPALADLISAGNPGDIAKVRDGLGGLSDSPLRRTLWIFAMQSEDAHEFRRSVASWFVEAMQAASAPYRKQVQWRLLAAAFVLTIALNADTLKMADQLRRGPIEQASILAAIELETAYREQPHPAWTVPESQTSPEVSSPVPIENLASLNDIHLYIGWSENSGENSARLTL